jgi:hypothetical protein
MRQQGDVLQGKKDGKSTKNCLFHGVFWLKWQFNVLPSPYFFIKKPHYPLKSSTITALCPAKLTVIRLINKTIVLI